MTYDESGSNKKTQLGTSGQETACTTAADGEPRLSSRKDPDHGKFHKQCSSDWSERGHEPQPRAPEQPRAGFLVASPERPAPPLRREAAVGAPGAQRLNRAQGHPVIRLWNCQNVHPNKSPVLRVFGDGGLTAPREGAE